jgi:hypothetical protein
MSDYQENLRQRIEKTFSDLNSIKEMMELTKSKGEIYDFDIGLLFSRYENMIRLKILVDLYGGQFSGFEELKENIDEKVDFNSREFRLFFKDLIKIVGMGFYSRRL